MGSLADLAQRIAALAATELGDTLRDALQGLSGPDALRAAAQAFRGFVRNHPGRYAATLGARPTSPDDEYARATARVLESLAVVLRGYGVPAADEVHALRMLRSALHGFSTLESGGVSSWAPTSTRASRGSWSSWNGDCADRHLRKRCSTVGSP